MLAKKKSQVVLLFFFSFFRSCVIQTRELMHRKHFRSADYVPDETFTETTDSVRETGEQAASLTLQYSLSPFPVVIDLESLIFPTDIHRVS